MTLKKILPFAALAIMLLNIVLMEHWDYFRPRGHLLVVGALLLVILGYWAVFVREGGFRRPMAAAQIAYAAFLAVVLLAGIWMFYRLGFTSILIVENV